MSVPTLDFSAWHGTPEARATLVREVGEALEQYGFVALSGHGIDTNLLDRAYAEAEQVFDLPIGDKTACETPEDGRQRGYTSFGVEHAKDQPIADLKEFWHIGRPPPTPPGVPPNRFPEASPAFGPTFLALFEAMDAFAADLLRVVATYLALPEDYFADRAEGGNSLLRAIHYPPLATDAPEGAVRAAAHEDVNLITILPASTAPGLELLTRDGRWIAVEPPAGAMICDTGDMMARMTKGRMPATTHRVVNPRGEHARSSRYAIPFFVHPRPEVRLDAIDGSEPGPTADAFLKERLRAIGLS